MLTCSRTRASLGALTLLALLATTTPARAVPDGILYGVDLDIIGFDPQPTEPGFEGVLTVAGAPGVPAEGEIEAGFLTALPTTDFRVVPLTDPTASELLWADGHSLLPGQTATLQVRGVAPGDYTLILLSHNPGGTVLAETSFWVNEVFAGSVVNVPESTDLWAEQTVSLPITVGEGQPIDIRWEAADSLILHANFNGAVLLVPESGLAALLALAAAACVRSRCLRAEA